MAKLPVVTELDWRSCRRGASVCAAARNRIGHGRSIPSAPLELASSEDRPMGKE